MMEVGEVRMEDGGEDGGEDEGEEKGRRVAGEEEGCRRVVGE
jgi:hypothetical protein